MSDTAYQLAPAFAGQTLVHENWNKVVTADNLTDEDVDFFIAQGRNDLFIRKDGKPVAAVSAAAGEDLSGHTKPELQARYKEALGSEADDKLTKAQLIEAIEGSGNDRP